MGQAYKNFWSLNTDEAVVTGILRGSTPKNVEVLMPLNAQLKDTDLILMNMDTKESLKIQVKGSRAYEPRKNEVVKFGDGSAGWFYLKKDIVHKSTADFFIFLIYVLKEDKHAGRRIIAPHTLTIATKELVRFCSKYKKVDRAGKYNFYFWINPLKNKSIEFRDEMYDTSEYLDKRGFKKLNGLLL